MLDYLARIQKKKVWSPAKLPPGFKPIATKLFYLTQIKPDGSLVSSQMFFKWNTGLLQIHTRTSCTLLNN